MAAKVAKLSGCRYNAATGNLLAAPSSGSAAGRQKGVELMSDRSTLRVVVVEDGVCALRAGGPEVATTRRDSANGGVFEASHQPG